MQEFRSLKPVGLPADFDAEAHQGEPLVKEPKETQDRIEIEFVFPGFTVSDEMQTNLKTGKWSYREVGLSKCGWLGESGKPLLPSFGRYVQIPRNSEYSITVKKGNPVTYNGITVAAAQQLAMDGGTEHEYEYDREAYAKDELYPREIVQVTGPFDVDGYNALLVHVRPLQYNAAKKQITGYGNITVEISLKAGTGGGTADQSGFLDENTDKRAFGNLFLNPRRTDPPTVVSIPEREILRPVLRGPEFLIIYGEQFKTAALRLAKWKQMKGMATETVSINSVGNQVSAIKQYLRGRRRTLFSRLRYVLLFGDMDHITSETVDGNCTDHYYYTSTDAAAGHYVLPWMSGGRIPVRNLQQADMVVDQIIRYEKNPPSDPQYYRRLVVAAYFQDDQGDHREDRAYLTTMQGIYNYLVTLGLNVDRIYVTDTANPQQYINGDPIPPDVLAAFVPNNVATQTLVNTLNEGHLILGHRDHGSPQGWHRPTLEINNLSGVTTNMPSVVFSVNCQTGRFDANPTDCFAEVMLAKDGAAPSLIAATRNSGTWRNDSLIKALYDAMYPGLLPTFPGTTASYPVTHQRLGDMLNYGMSYLPVAHSGDDAGIKAHMEIYHVIGDPTLEVWVEQPRRLRVAVMVMRGASLKISMSECPVGANVSIWLGDKMLKEIHPLSPTFTIPLLQELQLVERTSTRVAPHIRPSLSICFSAPGYHFQEVKVAIPVLVTPTVPIV